MNNIEIVLYKPQYKEAFISLNREWITTYFRLEESDLKVFEDVENIITDGGQIFIALFDNKPVGCCALLHHKETGEYELAKMAVSPDHQGLGIGKSLGLCLVDYAKSKNVRYVFLEANTKLKASIVLYEKLGFKKSETYHPAYERCDMMMELYL